MSKLRNSWMVLAMDMCSACSTSFGSKWGREQSSSTISFCRLFIKHKLTRKKYPASRGRIQLPSNTPNSASKKVVLEPAAISLKKVLRMHVVSVSTISTAMRGNLYLRSSESCGEGGLVRNSTISSKREGLEVKQSRSLVLQALSSFMNSMDWKSSRKRALRSMSVSSYLLLDFPYQVAIWNLIILFTSFCTIALKPQSFHIPMAKKIENYRLLDCIGTGNYGQVFRASNDLDTTTYAVKVIPNASLLTTPKLEECMINEVKVLSKMGASRNIVRFYELIKTQNNHYFVYEFCNGGTLDDKIRQKGQLSETETLVYAKDLLSAFKVLNRHKVLHRDLKPQNILFQDGVIKLADFGLCKGLEPNQSMAKTMLGSPIYMAPQVLKGEPYTSKADIWSLGVILYEMLYGECPFHSNSIAALTSKIEATEAINFPSSPPVSEKTKKIVRRMLAKDHFRRIGWIQLFGQFSDTPNISSKIDCDLPHQLPVKQLNFSKETKNHSYFQQNQKSVDQIFSKLKRNVTTTENLLSEKNIEYLCDTSKSIDSYCTSKEVSFHQIPVLFITNQKEKNQSILEDSKKINSGLQPPSSKTDFQLKKPLNFEGRSDLQIRLESDRDSIEEKKPKKFESAKYMKYLNIPDNSKARRLSTNGEVKSYTRSRYSSFSVEQILPILGSKESLLQKVQKLHKEFIAVSAQCQYAIKSKDVIQIKFLLRYLEALRNKLKEAESACSAFKEPNRELKVLISLEVAGVEEVMKMGRIACVYSRGNKENQGKIDTNNFQRPQRILQEISFEAFLEKQRN